MLGAPLKFLGLKFHFTDTDLVFVFLVLGLFPVAGTHRPKSIMVGRKVRLAMGLWVPGHKKTAQKLKIVHSFSCPVKLKTLHDGQIES